ncbi:laminin subunit alpha-5 isoform X2 [Denticeps clupeoides]|uniref:laminin subunit alpha-5 isoform X2 n=1 Tax=Denticeps clupeoides TaxID=299321 RepID=UPI0010A5475C|nr:laminin subunit alpha-5 isoform X2 [Denticeps clupeoides]
MGGAARVSLLFSVLASALVRGSSAQEFPVTGPNGFSLHPPYFNLAEGTKITATATCGEDEDGRPVQDLYCKLVGGPVSGDPSQTIQGQYCDICSMGDSNKAHPISNAIDGTERWWQSPPLSRSAEYNKVNVTLDLGQLFHVAYVLIKFANSPRPDLWVLERSIDFGKNYQPWQFFASSKRDCIERFGQRTIERISHDDDVICTTEYSRIVPLENGEIVVSLVNGRPGAMNFSYSPVLREFTKATNIRLRFLRTNTLLGHLMGKALRDPTVTRRYYYSIKDISIGGRCVCNGHAEACNAQDPNDPFKLQCDCKHNTCGPSCDRCCSGFNQLPWQPATTDSANECEPCNCNKHSDECYYNPEVDQRSTSMDVHGEYRGGGVCVECQHHTTGINCERCIPGYYRSPEHPLDSSLACSSCNCQTPFTDGNCEDLTGRCYCKPNFTGLNCQSCAQGYDHFPDCFPVISPYQNSNGEALPAGHIINCECSAAGTEGNSCRPDPRTRTCLCKAGFTGQHCDTCAAGHFGLNCQRCQCSGTGCLDGSCDQQTGQCFCRSGFDGYSCEQCAPGYFSYPVCQLCGCSSVGSISEICHSSGQCVCRTGFQGPRCDQCRSGFPSYPNCHVCTCDPRTSLDTSCGASGQCRCRPNYSGQSCEQCAPGYYGYPSCTPCQCSPEGSKFSSCDQVTGQCTCLPNVVGLRCDTCGSGSYGFPYCHAGTCNPAGSVQNEVLPTVGSCECKPYVEGVACDQCKPLYWNLSPDVPYGCSSCECNTVGTVSAVAECTQSNGQCYCKPNVCSGTCTVCKDGYFNLQKDNYFGCQGCQCDIGGSAGLSCGETNGRCRCRPNVEGAKCNQPRPDHYFPDLHHLKFEIEDGIMLDGRPVRFGYDHHEFEGFSWRGYALMSPIQRTVTLAVQISEEDVYLTRFILRYVNRGAAVSNGKITTYQMNRKGSEQSKQIVFSPSSEPTFVTVPQNNYVEPFVLNPGAWTIIIEAEGILLDYLVLLPSSYYEAPILQFKVTEPCMYTSAPDASQNCLMYKYLPLEKFLSVSGNDASCRSDNHLPRPCQTEKITPRHPPMAMCSGNDLHVQLVSRVPAPGHYALVVEYSSEDETAQKLTVSVSAAGERSHQEQITLPQCKYSFLCRAVSVDDRHQVAVFTLSSEADVQFIADRANFFLHKIYLIPRKDFTMEYLMPKVHCISTHGQFSPDRGSCIPSRFQTPPQSLVLKEGQGSSVQEPILASPPDPESLAQAPHWLSIDKPSTAADNTEYIQLNPSQNAVVYTTRVHTLGRYVFIVHYHQPQHPTYAMQVYVNGGRIWQGHANASFCPHGYGCRSVLVSENQIILDVTDHEVIVTVQVPEGKTLWLDYVMVVPEGSYTSSCLSEEPLDKSYDFISLCGQNSFYINLATSSAFCQNSAVSLSAFFNNGALPCGCHEVGADSDSCEPFGGQCHCRPNVIGRDCSQCATGYWGFPNCRPCACGERLCEPVTGDCICPPRTQQPDCTQCEPQTFGCHPLVGCEICNCSQPGVTTLDISCDTNSGQCSCKNNIIGRRCDQCTHGFYGYPNCRPCDCNEAGTEGSVCDPHTGRCLCKENVEGFRCDQCRVGTFHLDPTNPKGCTKCFCFGATDRCRSSEKRRKEIMDMGGWVLLRGDRQEVPVSVYQDQDLVEADLSDVPDVYQELYWHAPLPYLGDKVSSYGGYLRYRLESQAMRGDSLILPSEASRPDVILKGNQMTLVYMEREYSSADEPHEGVVHLVEGSFRHAQTGNAVSREELMMVLVGLESLQIRALHSQSAQGVSLRAAVLEGAENLPSGRHANNVEICLCPANYLGDSCQQCSPGFYRDEKGLFLGKCVPCHCNGHSDQCLDGTGICVNCRHNTAGDHCEKCTGGFHTNNTVDGHAMSCTSCPCPLQVASNNFAIGCVEKPNHMRCLCMPGYAGPKCERCAPGFYGNPMVIGSTCQPCQCNDNTDPNMLFSDCHPLTGECQGCMYNTAGPHCDVCAPGFYGDAIVAKNCTRCNCSPCGTASCEAHSGRCHCKPGVTGAFCDHCEDDAFGFDSCSGCRRCECDSAAALQQPCDPASGSCTCQPGVNGPNCLQCAPGYWGYSPNGCRKCECRTGRCDPRTGECKCADGLTGRQCDICVDRKSVPVQHGQIVKCEPCDNCVRVLLHDLDLMSQHFQSASSQFSSLNASAFVWAQLHKLNASMESITNAIGNYNSTLDGSRTQADMLEREIRNLNSDINDLQKKAEATGRKVDTLQENTNRTYNRADSLFNHIRNIMRDVNGIIRQLNRTSLDNKTQEEEEDSLAEKMVEVQAMLREMRFRSCSQQKDVANRELAEANKLLERMRTELGNITNEARAQALRDRLDKINSELMDLSDALNDALNNTAQAINGNNINQQALENIKKKLALLQKQQKEVEDLQQMAEDDVAQVNNLLEMLQDSKEEYERLAAQLDGARKPVDEKVQQFVHSASKIAVVEAAEKHAQMLDELAANLSRVIAQASQDGIIQRALNASQAYTNIIDSINTADTAAKTANQSATDALEHVKELDLKQLADAAKKKSNELMKEASALQSGLRNDTRFRLDNITNRLEQATDKQENVQAQLGEIWKYLNHTADNTTAIINASKSAVKQANTTATRVISELAPIQKQLEEWQKQYGYSNATTDDINNTLMDANKSVGALGEIIPQLLAKLDGLQNNTTQMPNISQSIMKIRQLIDQARSAANKISVPVKFNGTSGVQVRTPINLDGLAAYTSLKFYVRLPEPARRKRQLDTTTSQNQFVLYLGSKNSSKEFIGMTLEEKKIKCYINVGGSTANVQMNEAIGTSPRFNSIVLQRILQFGELKMITMDLVQRESKKNLVADGDLGLLNLQPEDTVFYVGGYPDNFTPPSELSLPGFTGCIELQSLNEEVISLYNFENTFNLNTTEVRPCTRERPVRVSAWLSEAAAHFDGTGYAEIALKSSQRPTKIFDQDIRLLSQNGIILLLSKEEKFICVAVVNGRLKLFHNVDGKLVEAKTTDKSPEEPMVSNAEPQTILLVLMSNNIRVVLKSVVVLVVYNEPINALPEFEGSYFLGGVPEDRMPESLKRFFVGSGSVRGCFKRVQCLGVDVDLRSSNSTGLSYSCPDDLLRLREAYFSGQSFVSMKLSDLPSHPDVTDNFYAGIGFRTSNKNGLILQHPTPGGICDVSLNDGHVVVQAHDNQVTSMNTYNDDISHYVALYSNSSGLFVYLDDVLETGNTLVDDSLTSGRGDMGDDTVYLGGRDDQAQKATNITGCISNYFIKTDQEDKAQEVVDLMKAEQKENINLKCPAVRKPLQILASPERPSKLRRFEAGLQSFAAPEACQQELSTQVPDAWQFSGSTNSRLRFDTLPPFGRTPHISMGVRLNSSDGLIFYAGGEKGGATMALLVSEGHLHVHFNGGKRKTTIRSRNRYSDGKWHTVFVKRERDEVSLIVDGINSQKKKVSGGLKNILGSPLYVGGLPPELSPSFLDPTGFVGCVRELKLNEVALDSPSHNTGVTPCHLDPLQPGVYFSGQGGHLMIDESLVLGQDFELQLEVRSVSNSGILLYSGGNKGQQLSLYLNQGEVTVLFNSKHNGSSVTLSPEEPLCDGTWHMIRIVKKSNVIQLHVAAASTHGITPQQSHSSRAKSAVYLGNIPDTVHVTGLPSDVGSFQGCVRRALLNHRHITLSKPLAVYGAVGTQGCPAL